MRYHQHQDTAGRIIEDHAYVVTAQDDRMHTLNPTATAIWRLAAQGCSPEEAARDLSQHFDVSYEQALTDSSRCLEELVELGVLVRRS